MNRKYYNLISMVFYITFMLALFYDKKCCNCINLFSCILWDLIVMSSVLGWWRLLTTVDFVTGSRLDTRERQCEEHMWKFKSQHISWVTRNLFYLRDDSRDALTIEILSVTLIPFTHTIYTLIIHKIVKMLFRRKP